MIKPSDIAPLRRSAPDSADTDRLKTSLAQIKATRRPFFLGASDLQPILHWKLGNQYGRVRARLAVNTDAEYREATRAAFAIAYPADPDRETELRVAALTELSGVGIGVASAILALVDPEHYCVIDFRGWRAVFGELRRTFSIRDYNRYLSEVRHLAEILGWTPQDTDLAIWEYDRRNHPRPSGRVA